MPIDALQVFDLVHIDEEPYNLATAHALWLARQVGARSLFFSWQNLLRRYPLPFYYMERYAYRRADHALAGSYRLDVHPAQAQLEQVGHDAGSGAVLLCVRD